MLIFGAVLLVLAAFYIWREYVSFLNKGTSELGAFVRLIEHMKDRMECYLETPLEWARDFSSDELEQIGFLGEIRNGRDMNSAYVACSGNLSIGNEAKSVLSGLFSHLGEGYLGTEIGIIKASLDKLKKMEETARVEKVNKTKAAGAMIGAVSIGAIILVL